MGDHKSTIGICRSAAEAMLSDNIQWRLDPRYILKLCEEADRIQTLERENAELRHIISNCAAALVTGAFVSPRASVEFMQKVPKEISLTVSDLRARRLAEQEGTGEAASEEHRLHTWSRGGICDDCGCTFSGLNRIDPCPGRAALREEKCE